MTVEKESWKDGSKEEGKKKGGMKERGKFRRQEKR